MSTPAAARTWLAVVLLAVALGLAVAGIWLPLPARVARSAAPGRTTLIATLVAWAVSIVTWLVALTSYVRRYTHAYDITAAKAAPPDHVAPITFAAVVVVFLVIALIHRGSGGTGLLSAVIGALAAALIFELPFDLIVMTRTYPPIPPDPAGYRVLFFLPLFAIEITTLLLLRLSPLVRLTRATFFALALMFGVFAIWALDGWDYPSTAPPSR